MKILNYSERSTRYILTFVFWNNLLALLLALALHNPTRRSFLDTLLVMLIVTHITGLVCLLSIDLFGSLLDKLLRHKDQNKNLIYSLPFALALTPGLLAGFYVGTKIATLLNIDWTPNVWEFIRIGLVVGTIIFLLNALYFNWVVSLREKFQKDLELKATQTRLLQSKLQVLMSELNPHLLFNSLNAVVELLREDSLLAEKMLLSLCDYYQSVLVAFDKKSITLLQEIQLCEKYLDMQKYRHKDIRLNVIIEGEDLWNFMLPPLLLQPVIENSLKYGFINRKKDEIKTITITAKRTFNRVVIIVHDNGTFMERVKTDAVAHGLRNCEERMKWFFNEGCTMNLTTDSAGTTVALDMPFDSPRKL